MSLRCLIADDEPPARGRLRRMLGGMLDTEVVGEASDGVAAIEEVCRLKPDLLLLDIDMPELDGLAVAAALPAGATDIVFVTAYDAHAVRAFELAAVDYLVKPVSRERLEAALTRVRNRRPREAPDVAKLLARLTRGGLPARMAVRCGAKVLLFDPSRVSAVLARDHYTAILVDGRELLADDSLDELTRRLDAPHFVRVHRSALLNLTFVRELIREGDRKYVAILAGAQGARIPISRERLPALKAALGLGPDEVE